MFIKHQNSPILILMEMLISVFLHIHFKEKLNHIHFSLLDKFITGMKLMENYHQLTHSKSLMQMIDLFKTVIQSKPILENNVKQKEFL